MSQALYREWRPLTWSEVVGQEHVVRTLKNAVKAERLSHAYLFSGPRGTGKTRAAKQTTRVQPDGKPKRMGALDAAATVLRKGGKPMHCKALITAMAEQGLWTSPAGKTPHATLYAAMLREIGKKGAAARFMKVDRGQFAFNG